MSIGQLVLTVILLSIIVGMMVLLLSLSGVRDMEMNVLNHEAKIDAILKRLKAQDKSIEELGNRIDGGVDVITDIQKEYSDLKKNAERTHLIALEALNEMNKYSVHGKHVKKEKTE